MVESHADKYDVIIIGAGMSGLAAGIRLAYYDRRVCILERHYTIGGLNSFYRLRGRDYDVGLHAVTNFTPKGTRHGPLARLLKQLRFRWDDFQLSPQCGSAIRFPDVELRFENGLDVLTAEIDRAFPGEVDGFRRLVAQMTDYDDLDEASFDQSARQRVGECIQDPLLVEMLFCPLMWYGNARVDDMDFGQFCIMFRSIFMEGFARPLAGVRLILKNLVRRFRELGGELRLRQGVDRIVVDEGRATGVILDDGREIAGDCVLSSAGWVETMRMCDDVTEVDPTEAGRMSFTESVSILDCKPHELGFDETIVFFNDAPKFHWRPSDDLCDLRTGVICSPNNYLYNDPDESTKMPDGVIRITSIANYHQWQELAEERYALEKVRWYDRAASAAVQFMPEFRHRVIDTDFFTPKTIRRFTWHDNGAVYGAPRKRLDGKTHLENVHICGTDQGFVGIVGAIVSGISIANQTLL